MPWSPDRGGGAQDKLSGGIVAFFPKCWFWNLAQRCHRRCTSIKFHRPLKIGEFTVCCHRTRCAPSA